MEFFDHSILDLGFTRRMETELDKIEEAHLDWRKVLDEFYGPFDHDLAVASQGMASARDTAEATDVKCPKCGAPMVKKLNRYGYYLRCTSGPECKTTLRVNAQGEVQEKEKPQPTGLKCDKCGSDVVRSVGRFGPYLHCVKYPTKECDYTMKLNKEGFPVRKFKPLPTDRRCEKCKSPLVVRVTSRGKKRKPFLSCSNFPKCRLAQDLPPELEALGQQAMAQWQANEELNRRDQAIYSAHAAAAVPAAVPAPAPAPAAPPASKPD
jgi:DNA topoisomerase-1